MGRCRESEGGWVYGRENEGRKGDKREREERGSNVEKVREEGG